MDGSNWFKDMFINEAKPALNGRPGGSSSGDTSWEDSFVEGTLTEYTNDRVTSIGGHRFRGMTSLKKVSFPNAKTAHGGYSFADCKALVEVNFPKLETISNESFLGLCALTSVTLPSLKTCGGVAFHTNPLVKAEFFVLSSLPYRVFQNCGSFTTLILRNTGSICELSNVNAFQGTPFASGGTGGTVYVPSALIETYKTATNWSTLYSGGTCNFVALEGSEYE